LEFLALSKSNSSTAVIRGIQPGNYLVLTFGFKLKEIYEVALLAV
jgi:hypothetical protein